jgi:hypothetical protein
VFLGLAAIADKNEERGVFGQRRQQRAKTNEALRALSQKAVARAQEDVAKMVAAGELEPLQQAEQPVTDDYLLRKVADDVIGQYEAYDVENAMIHGEVAARIQFHQEGIRPDQRSTQYELRRRAWTIYALGVLLMVHPEAGGEAKAEVARLLGWGS